MTNNSAAPRVAVVGAGAAGTTAAWKLRDLLGKDAVITVYERAEQVGGRAHSVDFAGLSIEIGGSILHSSGELVKTLMEQTGAREGESGLSIDGKDETYGFWTDRGFPVLTHTSVASMGWGILKYAGPRSALAVVKAVNTMADKFKSNIYRLQAEGRLFETPQELLEAMGLAGSTDISVRDNLLASGASPKMIDNIVGAINNNMYNQDAGISALGGLVGLSGAGLSGGYLYSIEGGNWSVFKRTLDLIGADVRLSSPVSRISHAGETGGWEVTSGGQTESYDAVVLAAPLALGDAEITVDGEQLAVPKYPYQQVNTTLVVGEPNPEYFGLKPGARVPSTVFVADSAPTFFKSFGVTGFSSQYNQRVYKIFSADVEIDDEALGKIFTRVDDVLRWTWRGAYPVLTPGIDHVPFELAPGLGYACALETAAGSIEIEAIAGQNVAGLIARQLEGR